MQKEDYLNKLCQRSIVADSYCAALVQKQFEVQDMAGALIYINASFQAYIAYQYILMGCTEDLSKVSAVTLLSDKYKDYVIGIHPRLVGLVKVIDQCIDRLCSDTFNLALVGKSLQFIRIAKGWIEYLLQTTDLSSVDNHIFFFTYWDGEDEVDIISQLVPLNAENT